MHKKWIFWAVFAGVASIANSGFASEEGTLVSRLESSGFQCESVTSGYQCVGGLSPYPEPVAVIFPRGFSFKGRFQLHLHGYVLGGANDKTFSAILKDFNFATLLEKGGVSDSLLLVPSSKGSCDTYIQYFTSSTRFEGLMKSLERVTGLVSQSPRLTLSGHSGAFQPMGSILKQTTRSRTPGAYLSAVDQVMLFDAAYSSIDTATFKAWLSASSSHGLRAVFRPGTGTETGSRKLWSVLSSAAFSTTKSNVLSSGRGEIVPAASSGDAANHWGTVRVYLPDFLSEI